MAFVELLTFIKPESDPITFKKVSLRISVSLLKKKQYLDEVFYKRMIYDFESIVMESIINLSISLASLTEWVITIKTDQN